MSSLGHHATGPNPKHMLIVLSKWKHTMIPCSVLLFNAILGRQWTSLGHYAAILRKQWTEALLYWHGGQGWQHTMEQSILFSIMAQEMFIVFPKWCTIEQSKRSLYVATLRRQWTWALVQWHGGQGWTYIRPVNETPFLWPFRAHQQQIWATLTLVEDII